MKIFYSNIKSILDTGKPISEDFRVKHGAIYWHRKQYWQMIGIMTDDTFLIRMDSPCIRSTKLLLDTFKKLNYQTKLGLCDYNLEIWGIKGEFELDYDTSHEMIVNLFHYYTEELAHFFEDNGHDFIDMIFETVEYFNLEKMFKEIINDDKFWSAVLAYYTQLINFTLYSHTSPAPILVRHLNPVMTKAIFLAKEREKIIKDLLD